MPKPKKRKKKDWMSILIVAKQNKTGIRHAKKLEALLKRYTENIHMDRSTSFRLRRRGTSVKKFKGDLVITIGGDGTFLLAAHRTNVPILPVKIEGRGFLCTTTFKELEKNLKRLFRKDFSVEERMRIKCARLHEGKIAKYIEKIHRREYPPALNEIVFARKRPSKLLDLEIRIDGTAFDVVGDGVMFSTPAGSTAYSASAGGPIIDPSLDVINIIPLYPFYSKLKPVVVPAHKKVEVMIKSGDCSLVVDGHGGDYLKTNTKFVVDKTKPVKVIRFEKEPKFYERVKSVLIEE